MTRRSRSLATLEPKLTRCRACERLVEWREHVANIKRAAYADQDYWGRPVPGFGDPNARLLIVGLAPAAHGANRTGRMFTGDRSGDWLYRALHETGFANQPESIARGDGLELTDAWVTSMVKCAPPDNKPTTAERDACSDWIDEELRLLENVQVIVALGGFGWDGALGLLRKRGHKPARKPKFGHAAEAQIGPYLLLGSYHPSQQNTFTKRLTRPMLRGVLERARLAACGETPRAASLGLSAEGFVAETCSTPGTAAFRLRALDENPAARRHDGFHHRLLGLLEQPSDGVDPLDEVQQRSLVGQRDPPGVRHRAPANLRFGRLQRPRRVMDLAAVNVAVAVGRI
jgi:uracil-DNA glycosylase family 4